jgi:hypothetical protein
MAFITGDDLATHIYPEILTEIVRGNTDLTNRAIASALGEVMSYLDRYNLPVLFSDASTDEHLKSLVKDVACWQLLRLANPNIDLTLFRTAYEDAIAFLEKVQKGIAAPPGWPYLPNDPATPFAEGAEVQWQSTPKSRQHF